MCQIGEADVDACLSDEEPAEGIKDRQQGAPMGKNGVKVCRTLIASSSTHLKRTTVTFFVRVL